MKSIKKNYFFNVCNQILIVLTPLITTPYISRVLQAEGIGEYSYAFSIVSYFVLFAGLGTSHYGQREISYVQNNKKARSITFWEIEIVSLLVSLVVFLLYLIFAIINKLPIIYFILSINIVSVIFDISWLFQGLEDFARIVKRNTAFKIVNIIYIFLFVKTKDDILIYTFGMSIMTLLGNISLWGRLSKVVYSFQLHRFSILQRIKETLSLFIPNMAISIYTVLDKTMLGYFTDGKTENGYYEQSIKISKLALTFVTSLVAAVIPRIGFYFNNKDLEKAKKYIYKSYNFVWMLSIPLCIGLICISDILTPWFFGIGFKKVEILLPILSLLIIFIGLSNVTGLGYLISTMRQDLLTKSVVIGAVSNFGLNLLLIPRLLSIGAATASVSAEFIVTAVQFYYVRKEFPIKNILRLSINYFIAGIIMLSILLLEKCFLLSGMLETAIMIITGAIIYFFALIVLKDTFFISYLTIALNFIKEKNKRKG